MSIDTDQFATELRRTLDLDALHSTIDPAVALARGRRSARRRAGGIAAGGVVAMAALGLAVITLPGLPWAAPTSAPAAPDATSTPDATNAGVVRPPVALTAAGVAAATGVAGAGSPWDTGLSLTTADGAVEVHLAAGTPEDLTAASAGTDVPVDHALRVILGDPRAPSASAVIAWGDAAQPVVAHRNDPSTVTLFQVDDAESDGGLVGTNRLLAGVVPAWMPDARVVFFTAAPVRDAGGATVHAVEIPTFADPTGSGARVYVATAGADVTTGPRPRGIFFVSPDGTFVDAEGTCTADAALCAAPRADGIDLAAELLRAIGG